MKFLLDEGAPRRAAAILTAHGHETVHATDVAPAGAADAELLAIAQAQGRVIVTFDADFHALLATGGHRVPSVIRIRIQGLDATRCAAVVEGVAASRGEVLEKGAAVSVNARAVRVRMLPL